MAASLRLSGIAARPATGVAGALLGAGVVAGAMASRKMETGAPASGKPSGPEKEG